MVGCGLLVKALQVFMNTCNIGFNYHKEKGVKASIHHLRGEGHTL